MYGYDGSIETISSTSGFDARIIQDIDASNPFTTFDQATQLVIEEVGSGRFDYDFKADTVASIAGYDAEDYVFGSGSDRSIGAYALLKRHARMEYPETDPRHVLAMRSFTLQDYGSNGLQMINDDDNEYCSGPFCVGYITRKRYEEMVTTIGDTPMDEVRANAAEVIKAELNEFEDYVEGNVFGIVIEDDEGDIVDSCCGFYGYDYAKEEAGRMLDAAIEDHKGRFNRAALMSGAEIAE